MSIFLDVSRFDCPSCKKVIEVQKIQDFSARFSVRKSFGCPHCGSRLNWAKLPHHFAHYGLWSAVLMFPLPIFGVYSYNIGMWVLGFNLLVVVGGIMNQKLVLD